MCHNRPQIPPTMLCGHCGATTSPRLDKCGVCDTPTPQEPSRIGQPTATDVSLDGDETTLSGSGANALSSATFDSVPTLEGSLHFTPRYTIVRRLGSGGMAVVYLAWDESLGSTVALKLIRVGAGAPDWEKRQLNERFKRELKLARQVSHPNVVRIHDLGEVNGTLYLTMEYVQGSDLSTLLRREGRLSLQRSLALARQIASGLAAAHRAGIVHRDLKPANVMVDEQEQALLMDFGIARSTGDATPQQHTRSIMGTLDYMAPEQARGEPADERTDVYAFGLILYELLVGGPAATTEKGLANLIARLEKGPPPLRSVLPEAPPDLTRIVAKCLDATPAARYATANELLADLEALDDEGVARVTAGRLRTWNRAAVAAILGGLLVTGTWWLTSSRTPGAPAAPRASLPILIVDFENRAGEAVFEGALEQALSIAIEGAPFITAFSRREAAGLAIDLKLGPRLDESVGRLIASREGIPVILAGMIERHSSGYRIAVRTVAADHKEPLAVIEATAADKGQVLAAVGRIAEGLRRTLGDATPSTGQQAETFTAASLDAVRAFTIAQELSSRQKDADAVTHIPRGAAARSGVWTRLFRSRYESSASRPSQRSGEVPCGSAATN